MQGQQFEYYEDWGEALVNKSSPVLCVLDIEGSNITVLEGIPTDISPGQVHSLCLYFRHGFKVRWHRFAENHIVVILIFVILDHTTICVYII